MNEVLKLNLPEEIVIKILNGGGGGSVTTDSALSETSKNPVENKVITLKINEIIGNENSALGDLSLTGLQKAVGEAFSRTVQNLDSIISVSERVENKQDKPIIIESADSNVTVSLESNQIYYAGTIESLTLNAPATYKDGLYTSYLSFKSGSNPTKFTQNAPFKFVGDDVSADGTFTPQPDTGYELMAMDVGSSVGVIVRVGAF